MAFDVKKHHEISREDLNALAIRRYEGSVCIVATHVYARTYPPMISDCWYPLTNIRARVCAARSRTRTMAQRM